MADIAAELAETASRRRLIWLIVGELFNSTFCTQLRDDAPVPLRQLMSAFLRKKPLLPRVSGVQGDL